MKPQIKQVYVYNDYKLIVFIDPNPENPRNMVTFGNIIIFNQPENCPPLGDPHSFKDEMEMLAYLSYKVLSFDEIAKILFWAAHTIPTHDEFIEVIINRLISSGRVEILPVYLTENGGLQLIPLEDKKAYFNRAGWMFVSLDELLPLLPAKKVLEMELTVYNMYLAGEVYGYIITRGHSNPKVVAEGRNIYTNCPEKIVEIIPDEYKFIVEATTKGVEH